MLRKHSKVAAQWETDNQSIDCKQDGDFKQARQASGSYWSKALELNRSVQHCSDELIITALMSPS